MENLFQIIKHTASQRNTDNPVTFDDFKMPLRVFAILNATNKLIFIDATDEFFFECNPINITENYLSRRINPSKGHTETDAAGFAILFHEFIDEKVNSIDKAIVLTIKFTQRIVQLQCDATAGSAALQATNDELENVMDVYDFLEEQSEEIIALCNEVLNHELDGAGELPTLMSQLSGKVLTLVDEEIFEDIVGLIAQQRKKSLSDDITMETDFFTGLSFDEIGMTSIFQRAERHFHISLLPEETKDIRTVGNLFTLIQSKIC